MINDRVSGGVGLPRAIRPSAGSLAGRRTDGRIRRFPAQLGRERPLLLLQLRVRGIRRAAYRSRRSNVRYKYSE